MERVRSEQGGGDEVEEPKQTAATASKKKPAAAAPEDTGETVPRSKKAAKIAYTPLDAEDPSFTIFFGMKFSANVEREVTNLECIALAKQNPWFKVDGKQGPKRAKLQPRDDDGLAARSGLPDGADPAKAEVEATAEDFV